MKEWLKRFLKKLEEENKKAFGNQRLDCCNINKGKGSLMYKEKNKGRNSNE